MKSGVGLKLALVALSAVFMVGCKSFSKNDAAVDDAGMGTGVSGAGEYGTFTGADLTPEEAATLREQRVFYFEYDSSRLNPEEVRAVEAHAYYLVNNPSAMVRVEGHTDARGSREYNIALGERRAQAVARILYLAGAQNSQVAVVSYGAEKPAVQGSGEEAWRFNRRAEIVYEAQ